MRHTYNDTWTEIANEALELLNKPHISQLSDSGEIAASIRLHMPNAVETVASRFEWACLTCTTKLAAAMGMTSDELYQYELPNNFLRVVAVYAQGLPWERRGNYITTLSEECAIKYIALPTTPQDLDTLLKRAVANLLASLCAIRLTGSTDMQSLYFSHYENFIQQQMTIDKDLLIPTRGNTYWLEELYRYDK